MFLSKTRTLTQLFDADTDVSDMRLAKAEDILSLYADMRMDITLSLIYTNFNLMNSVTLSENNTFITETVWHFKSTLTACCVITASLNNSAIKTQVILSFKATWCANYWFNF